MGGLIHAWTIWPTGPATSTVGLLLAGAVTGLLSVFAVPHRLIAVRVAFPGLSLPVVQLAVGAALYLLRDRLRCFRWRQSTLAGECGGAAFAFSLALIRWWLVGGR
ncbi:MAG TPA: hypothetical protein VJN43_18165 [Bryobacteraceae bacterium]|nr:hypothetical protein [Bryobacteraceae bacterium]